ncbi:hypothetical protein VQ045_16925 [Aurantimonas sp. E1-2-R+4]|uniref:hypothetical protein n=1 Tax=Aurantimonas sp. E1-2-R+4 TaxID=3113714 RepID=UPI002F93C45D
MKEVWIRLLSRDGGRVEDMQHDVDLAEFGGTVPAVGDRIVEMLKGDSRAYRVVERLFETGSREPYINLILERADLADIRHLPRFASDR